MIINNELFDGMNRGEKKSIAKAYLILKGYVKGWAYKKIGLPPGISKGAWEDDKVLPAFNDAFMAMLANLRSGKFNGESNLETYLVAIFKNTYYGGREYLRFGQYEPDENTKDREAGPDRQIAWKDLSNKVLPLLNEAGEKCYELVVEHHRGFKDDDLALRLGYKNAGVVTARRHQCMSNFLPLVEKKFPGELGFFKN